jgi:hypothetical protein
LPKVLPTTYHVTQKLSGVPKKGMRDRIPDSANRIPMTTVRYSSSLETHEFGRGKGGGRERGRGRGERGAQGGGACGTMTENKRRSGATNLTTSLKSGCAAGGVRRNALVAIIWNHRRLLMTHRMCSGRYHRTCAGSQPRNAPSDF